MTQVEGNIARRRREFFEIFALYDRFSNRKSSISTTDFQKIRHCAALSAPCGPFGPGTQAPYPQSTPPPQNPSAGPFGPRTQARGPPPHPPVGVKRYVPLALRFQHPMLDGCVHSELDPKYHRE